METVTGVEPLARRVRVNVERVIIGKAEVIEQALVAVLCEGHVLIEDVPGIGKTMLAKALARSLGCSFRRIQCTPDLLPSDITGLEFFNQRTQAFEFRPGPIFAQIILADEINRATPRTQSALLESMEERQVTVEGQTRILPRPFLVLATQNPVELQGTFPLPEAQLDRFLLRIVLGYPSAADEQEIRRRYRTDRPLDDLQPVATPEEVLTMAEAIRTVYGSGGHPRPQLRPARRREGDGTARDGAPTDSRQRRAAARPVRAGSRGRGVAQRAGAGRARGAAVRGPADG